MVMENIHVRMDICMKDNGLQEKSKAREFKAGQMKRFILEISKKAANTGKVSWNLGTEVITKANFQATKSTVEVLNVII